VAPIEKERLGLLARVSRRANWGVLVADTVVLSGLSELVGLPTSLLLGAIIAALLVETNGGALRMRRISLWPLVALWATIYPAGATDAVWEPAPRSDDFVDSIGVCTHWSYGDTPYAKAYDLVRQHLAESGIRHVRDGLYFRELELWHAYGIGVTVVSDPWKHDLEAQMTEWKTNPGLLDMIEGPNEPNNFWPPFDGAERRKLWPDGIKLWQEDLYKAVRAEPLLAQVPVTSPTPILDGGSDLAPLASFDDVAFHPYAGGAMPSTSIPWGGQNMRHALALLGSGNAVKRLVATESGYHNCLSSHRVAPGGQPGISETAGGKYFPRHFAEYWNAGIVRTFTYELVDESINPDDPEANFGLLHHDASPKPAFIAVSNLISLLSESHWDAKTLRRVRPAAPDRAFPLAIEGPPSIHHTVLSRADGSIDLLLWQEVSSFDLSTRKDLSPAPEQVIVHLTKPVPATLYRPLAGIQPQKKWDASSAIVVFVPDEVVVLRLAASPLKGAPPAAPTDLAASTTGTSATLHWRCHGSPPAAFIVSRLGRYLGTVSPLADGSASFSDDALLPGLGFPYAVRAVDASGLLSPPAEIVAQTPDYRPDLVVESITWDPLQPKAGDEVRFSGTVANRGNAPTPDVTLGLTFSVNDTTVCWSDNSHEPLAPGARRTLITNDGPGGKATWTCAEGTFQIKAIVDDLNRIQEANKGNNSLRAILTAPSRPHG
jgi:hypothetical protein